MSRRDLRPWAILRREEVFAAGRWIRVERQSVALPDGRVVDDYHQVEIPDCSIVYARTEDGGVVVERQYKHGPRAVGLSLPAGGVEPGEAPLDAARRELLEETGFVAQGWRALGTFFANGNYGGGRAHLFVATGARREAAPDSGDLEDTEILVMSPAALEAALAAGEVHLMGAAALIALVAAGREAGDGA